MGRRGAETPTTRRRDIALPIVFGVLLFVIYSANGRAIPTLDSLPAALLPVALLRGDGLVLDRFRAHWPSELPYSVAEKRGHIVSRYPVAVPLLAVPLIARGEVDNAKTRVPQADPTIRRNPASLPVGTSMVKAFCGFFQQSIRDRSLSGKNCNNSTHSNIP